VHSTFSALTHGSSGLVFLYLTVMIPMFVALRRRQVPMSKLLWTVPVLSVPVALIAALVVTVVSSMLGISKSALQPLFAIASLIGIGYASGLYLTRSSALASSYRRGAFVANEDPTDKSRGMGHRPQQPEGSLDSNAALSLAGQSIAQEDETKHFKFIGTTGTGKSTAIREILSSALARGDRAVITDPHGGYLDNFYDPNRGDIILNPFSPEGMRWNPLDEITNDYDVDQLARSLIADTGDPDQTWTEHARTFFIAVTQQALVSGIKDSAELYRLLIKAPAKELRLLLAGTSAGPLLEDGNERMFGSVRGTATSAIRALGYTTRQEAPYFSVRNWVRHGSAKHNGGHGGVLFIPYKAGEIAALRSLISAWVRIAIFEAMDRGEGDQRLWFVVDELDALGTIDGLKDALARLRKFGGRTIIGFQSIAQVSGTYGRAAADTIVENCGNTLILRCSASERGGTSEFASKLIGQREVMHTTESVTRTTKDWFGSTTTSKQRKIEPAVMASEIERLSDLQGFLKFASTPDWRRVRLTPVSYPTRERPRSATMDTPVPPATVIPAAASPIEATTAVPAQPAERRAPARKRSRKEQDKMTQATTPRDGTVAPEANHDDGGAKQDPVDPEGGGKNAIPGSAPGAELG
jgi:type IV secretory pathway TraG/TraD family ATPase VirD4